MDRNGRNSPSLRNAEETMIQVAINGAAGRMGRRFVDLVTQEEDMQVAAAL